MKRFLFLLLTLPGIAAEVQMRAHVGLDAQVYLLAPSDKHDHGLNAFEALELTYAEDALKLSARMYAQQDWYDFQAESEHSGRTFARLDELYGTYTTDSSQWFAGRNIRFWGALEARNIVDGFNVQDWRSDLFITDKIGAANGGYSYYMEQGTLSLIVKFEEADQPMAKSPYVYNFFPAFVTYDETLQTENSRDEPSVYVSFSGSTETEIALDYALILEHGYDSQRYFAPDGALDGSAVTMRQHAYRVNKAMTYNTAVIGATLVKVEALYADVIDERLISDYWHAGLGVEHSVAFDSHGGELGLIGEYYRYETLESGKYSDLDLFETFQNDLFLGVRYAFNDAQSSSFVGGVVHDMEYDEQMSYLEFETRLGSSMKLNLDYRYIEPSVREATAFALLGRHERIGIKLAAYF